MTDNRPPLVPGNFYHIFNRGNNREDIFIQKRNYAYFTNLWWKHTFPIAETYAICLLKNHFHAVVYIKTAEDLTGSTRTLSIGPTSADPGSDRPARRENPSGLPKPPSQYFSNLFNAYARGVNRATQRTGALFERPFERIPVTDAGCLIQLAVYIHQNPQKHGFVRDFREWIFSSYHDLLAEVPTRLQRAKVMNLFGGRDDFVRIHKEIQPLMALDEI